MRNEVLDAELKTRVPKQHKKKLLEIAVSRHLKVSDILREAIREKINSSSGQPALKDFEESIQ